MKQSSFHGKGSEFECLDILKYRYCNAYTLIRSYDLRVTTYSDLSLRYSDAWSRIFPMEKGVAKRREEIAYWRVF